MPNSRYSGPRFRAIREAAGIRRNALAERAQCNYDHLRLFEAEGKRGDSIRNVSPVLANRLANALTEMSGRTITVAEFTVADSDVAA